MTPGDTWHPNENIGTAVVLPGQRDYPGNVYYPGNVLCTSRFCPRYIGRQLTAGSTYVYSYIDYKHLVAVDCYLVRTRGKSYATSSYV